MDNNIELLRQLQSGIDSNIFSAAYLQIKVDNRLIFSSGVSEDPSIVVDADSRFDLASLTKIVCTLMSVLKLLSDQQLSLENSLSDIFPELNRSPWQQISVKSLLTHTSGFQPSAHLADIGFKTPFECIETIMPIQEINQSVIYSDLNFIWLGLIVEQVSGKKLSEFAQSNIFDALKMDQTSFSGHSAIPTRYNGLPDDSNARYFKTPVGHAGLFSSIVDLQKFVDFWLTRNFDILPVDIMDQATTIQTGKLINPRGFGWVLQQNDFGFFRDFSSDAYGHTGYTGTSLMIDPLHRTTVILLTNRTICGTDMAFVDFRKQIHHSIWQEYFNNV